MAKARRHHGAQHNGNISEAKMASKYQHENINNGSVMASIKYGVMAASKWQSAASAAWHQRRKCGENGISNGVISANEISA
jgi:hypothetical protein